METYTLLRTLADSWGLLALFVFFIGMVIWVFRPGSRKKHEDAANVALRNEDKPKAPGEGRHAAEEEANK